MNKYTDIYDLDALINHAYNENKANMDRGIFPDDFRGFVTTIIDIVTADENAPEWDNFNLEATDKEKDALNAIIEKLKNGVGNVSIVKLIQSTGISRPVWTSLIAKMEKYKVAFIENQGVKGTHIEIRK